MGAGAASEKADSFEECPIRYSTGGEYNILSGREILGSINLLEVPEPHVLEPFFLIRPGHDQTRLHLAVEAAQGWFGRNMSHERQQLRDALEFPGAIVLEEPEVLVREAFMRFDEDGELADGEVRAEIAALLEALVEATQGVTLAA